MTASVFARPLALAAVLVATPALAQSGDPFAGILNAIGLTSPDKPNIEYRERAPLVVPPSTDRLRNPEQSTAERNPQWPQDPDVIARRKKAEEARQPLAKERRYDVNEGAQVPLAVGQQRNRYAGVPTTGDYGFNQGATDRIPNLTPEQVRNALANQSTSGPATKPGEEPKRQYLTEPPTGYRKAAAGAPVKATSEPMFKDETVQMDVLRGQRR